MEFFQGGPQHRALQCPGPSLSVVGWLAVLGSRVPQPAQPHAAAQIAPHSVAGCRAGPTGPWAGVVTASCRLGRAANHQHSTATQTGSPRKKTILIFVSPLVAEPRAILHPYTACHPSTPACIARWTGVDEQASRIPPSAVCNLTTVPIRPQARGGPRGGIRWHSHRSGGPSWARPSAPSRAAALGRVCWAPLARLEHELRTGNCASICEHHESGAGVTPRRPHVPGCV
jgi:hypothetical protein